VLSTVSVSPSGFTYRSFRDNLAQHMSQQEVSALQALGEDFFVLVDEIAWSLFETRQKDHLLLELSSQEFLWETQVFVNRFLRNCVDNPRELPLFCRELRDSLANDEFQDHFEALLEQSYQEHFYLPESESALLV
jgi:hypothetical protein|tara:strand:+ start:1197 stop:1601 length:405 start_codon:yes stop_codon:yes gene_type:complete